MREGESLSVFSDGSLGLVKLCKSECVYMHVSVCERGERERTLYQSITVIFALLIHVL